MKDTIRTAAAHAWRALIKGDGDAALAHLNAVAQIDGAAAIIVAGFADTLAAAMRRRGIPGPPDTVRWVDVEDPSASVRDADHVPANAAWAGRVLMARWCLDEPQWTALWKAIPAGKESEYIATALESCVSAFKAYGLHREATS